ncbi:uncharacterized protein FOMMEDRAFT_25855 [Fomitiporia mediterranea MF3/22]|uniref:uncharacterized protein n=1 Tax=Fomitiporia mediterranea (strain MF3/22) TaxID=694068 RepID=UPI00044077BD|nr:uncharacterized protein FOMMEDRAFT_25855 [Fomitiporia mediterranea MF3/22]EJD06621.1 hypothetical protein FOMMEDRAFT_25855 [Fomitiporia mediterranea MF3/22]
MSSSDGDGPSQALVDHLQHVQQVDEKIYLGIQIAGGHILLPILVLTILFSRKVVYRGRSTDDLLSLNPSYDPCLIQAALLNGVQALTACTNLALVIYLWSLLRSFTSSKQGPVKSGFWTKSRKDLLYTCALLGFPFAVFVTFTVYSVVNADFTHSLAPGLKILRAVLTFTCLISLITVGFEDLLKRARQILTHYCASLNVAIIVHPDEILLVGISRNNLFNGVIDYFQAAIPLVAFLVFATEKDVLDTWVFWRKAKGQPEEKVSPEKESA